MADSFNNIGVVYKKKGDLENALVQHQKALEIRTRVFGFEHPDVAASYINIGSVYDSQVRGGAGNVHEIARYHDPHLWWRRPPGRGGVKGKHRSSLSGGGGGGIYREDSMSPTGASSL